MYNILYILENSCIFAEKRNMNRKIIVYMDKVSNGVVKSIIEDLVKVGEAEDLVEINSAAGPVFVRLVSRDRGINIVKNDSGVDLGSGLGVNCFHNYVQTDKRFKTCVHCGFVAIVEEDSGIPLGTGLFPEIISATNNPLSEEKMREAVVAFGGSRSSFPSGKRSFGYTPHEWECFQFEAVPGVNFKKRCVECGKQFDIKIKE